MSTPARMMKKAGLQQTGPGDIAMHPDLEVGQRTAEFRLIHFEKDVQAITEQLSGQLPQMTLEASALKKLRASTIEETFGRAPRISQNDRLQALRACPEYFERLDALMIQAAKLLRASQRAISKVRDLVTSESRELTRDWAREKVEMLLAFHTESAISMHFTDIEGLITLPSEGRRAKRMMQMEENAVNGKPVSNERKAKLAPKPKAKVRAKRAKAAIAEAAATLSVFPEPDSHKP